LLITSTYRGQSCMKYFIILLVFSLSLSFAEANDGTSNTKTISDIESSINAERQVDCDTLGSAFNDKSDQAEAKKCCKICKKGKACGDSCIAKSKTCTKGPGCACDGY